MCNVLCKGEVSTAETVIKEVMHAKYKVDKTIVHGLLRIFFHTCLMHVCE